MMKKHLPAIACLGVFVSWFFINEVIKVFRYTNFQILIGYISVYTVAAGAIYAIIYAFQKNTDKSWCLTQLILTLLLLFGYAKDNMTAILPFLSKYSVFIPLWLAAGIAGFILFNKFRINFTKLRKFFTVVVCIFLITAIIQSIQQPAYHQKLENVFNEVPVTTDLPNIYIFIFDEFSRLDKLQQLGHSSAYFQHQLADKKVQLISKTYSYTDLTSLCIAGLLNGTIPDFSKIPDKISNHDLFLLWNEYRNNRLFEYLNRLGYDGNLYGIMPMKQLNHHTSFDFRDFLMRDILRQNTLIGRSDMQLGTRLAKAGIPLISNWYYQLHHKKVYATYQNDSINLELVKKSLKKTSPQTPELIIAHFLFPHYPYIRDTEGQYKPIEKLFSNHNNNDPLYVEQVQYTEKVIMELVDLVQRKEQHTIAIFMGDHGYREHNDSSFSFQNFLAFYDSKNELNYHDSITYVNLMRNILNERFNYTLPEIEDSAHLIFRNKAR
jgi:hypothetical protein